MRLNWYDSKGNLKMRLSVVYCVTCDAQGMTVTYLDEYNHTQTMAITPAKSEHVEVK